MARKKHEKTEYEKARDKYRDASSRHVAVFEADMPEDCKRHVFVYADSLRKLGNDVVRPLNNGLEQMKRTKRYRSLQKDYAWHKNKISKLAEKAQSKELAAKDTKKIEKEIKRLEKERKKIASAMETMQKEFGVTKSAAEKTSGKLAAQYGINSIFAQSRAQDIWSGCEKILFSDGQTLHFKKRFDLPVIRARQDNRGIVIKLVKGELRFSIKGLCDFGVKIPKDDIFLQEEYQALVRYLSDPSAEEKQVLHFMETKEVVPVFRPCYAAIKCETIRGKLRVYVHVTIADEALPKKDKKGQPRKKFGKGRVGCDNGSQSFAAVSKDRVILDNLAERDHKSTKRSLRKMRILQQKIDRSIRAMNPDRFNADGTAKKIKGPYRKSKHCRRHLYLLHEQQRKDKASRLYAVRTDANILRSMGDELIIEPSNAKALQRRSKKPAEKSDKTITVTNKKGETKTVHKNKRKKRFGKSVLFRCPGAFQAELKKKFGSGYHEVARDFRASQYDHILDTYIKKKLSERWHELQDKRRVQRDIYSAFLMYCAKNDYTAADRQVCLREFDNFFKHHEATIRNIIENHYNICNSGISA